MFHFSHVAPEWEHFYFSQSAVLGWEMFHHSQLVFLGDSEGWGALGAGSKQAWRIRPVLEVVAPPPLPSDSPSSDKL